MSWIDQYMRLEFAQKMKCVESDDEPITTLSETVYQMSCFIDKDVKYMQTGLQNVSAVMGLLFGETVIPQCGSGC